MQLQAFKDYQQVHIWTGILSGLLLYICFVAGALTMFKGPLNQWALQADSQLPKIAEQDYDSLIKQVLIEHPDAGTEMTVYMPAAMPQHAPVQWIIEDPEDHSQTVFQASLDKNGRLISQQINLSAVGNFIDNIHRTAGIPGGDDHDAWGIFVMGVVCILYFVAIISGLIIFLPTWFKDLFALRKNKNNRRYWVDFHNILGISALPFHIVIAVTTIVFAYHDVLYGSLRQFVYQEQPMFSRAAPADIDRSIQHLASIEQLKQTVQNMEPEFEIAELRFSGLGTPRARVVVGGKMDGAWKRGPDYAFWVSDPYSAASGYTAMLPSVSGFAGKVVNGFFTLHFGGFGGSFIHWIYFFMGLSGSLLFLTGNIIWIESRRKKLQPSSPLTQGKSVRILARLTVGVTTGTLIGFTLALLVAKLIGLQGTDIRFWQMFAYYAGFLGAVLMSLLQKPVNSALQQLLLLSALLISLAVVSVLLAGNILTTTDISVSLISLISSLVMALLYFHLKHRKKTMIRDGVWC